MSCDILQNRDWTQFVSFTLHECNAGQNYMDITL